VREGASSWLLILVPGDVAGQADAVRAGAAIVIVVGKPFFLLSHPLADSKIRVVIKVWGADGGLQQLFVVCILVLPLPAVAVAAVVATSSVFDAYAVKEGAVVVVVVVVVVAVERGEPIILGSQFLVGCVWRVERRAPPNTSCAT
jgi:hypothetical protein